MNPIRLLRRCHMPLLALISLAQPLVLILYRLWPHAGAAAALFPVFCASMLPLLIAVPGRVRPAVLCACAIILLGAGRLLLSGGAVMVILPAGCALLMLYALSHADKDPAQASPIFYLFCILAQLIALFLLEHADGAARATALVQGMFYLWLVLFLLAFNRISLNSATLARYRLSAGMARTGAVLTVFVYLLALLLCAMPAVVSGVIWLFGALREGSIRFLLFLIHLFPAESMDGSMGGGMPPIPQGAVPAAAEHSLFSVVLERIAGVLSLLVLIAGCAILLRLLALALVRLARSILAHLKRYAASVTEDYEDEITDTREEDGERSMRLSRRKAKIRQIYPDTPAGRIRRRYAQLLSRHDAWASSSTARENLPPSAASLYERARYSEHTPTAEDALRFELETQSLHKTIS